MADSSIKKRVKELIREAQRTGDVDRSREFLRQALDLDPSSEGANLWMAIYSIDEADRAYYLQRVQEINPRNLIAPRLRQMSLSGQFTAPAPVQEEEPGILQPISRRLLLVVAISLVLLGAVVLFRVQRYQTEKLLAEQSATTLATVTDKQAGEAEGEPAYQLLLSFEAQGQTFDNIPLEVSEALFEEIEIGSQQSVRYLPADPTVVQLASQSDPAALEQAFLRDLIVLIMVLSLPVDLFIVFSILKQRREKAKLMGA